MILGTENETVEYLTPLIGDEDTARNMVTLAKYVWRHGHDKVKVITHRLDMGEVSVDYKGRWEVL